MNVTIKIKTVQDIKKKHAWLFGADGFDPDVDKAGR